jgi:hypothetical protein
LPSTPKAPKRWWRPRPCRVSAAPETCGYPTCSACFPCKPFCKQSFPCAEMEGNPRALSHLGCKGVAVQQYSTNCRATATLVPRIAFLQMRAGLFIEPANRFRLARRGEMRLSCSSRRGEHYRGSSRMNGAAPAGPPSLRPNGGRLSNVRSHRRGGSGGTSAARLLL